VSRENSPPRRGLAKTAVKRHTMKWTIVVLVAVLIVLLVFGID
jgi:uncharacterized integral membrane protein